MAEKKSRSRRPSTESFKSKRTKDAEFDADADMKMKTVDAKKEDDIKENAAENGDVTSEKKERKGKKRKLAENDEQAQVPVSEEKKEDESERKTKKKRVSFSAEDNVNSPSPSPVEGDEGAEADDENGESSKKEKKKKKKEKEKSEKKKEDKGSASTVQKLGETPVLAYLSQYHNDRSSWKFQKIREIQLFKHILSLEHVPATYEAALLSYLQGLRGEAAKQRLREVAQAAIKMDVEETKETYMDLSDKMVDGQGPSPTENYRKAVYAFRTKLTAGELTEDLGETFEQLDEEMLQNFRKRRRAEIVYFAVDGRVFTMSNLKAPPQKGKNAAQNKPVIKKKKNRTAVVEISSSSDSDSDSDDDKNSAEPEPVKKQPVKRKKKKSRTAVVEFSSSSESSSSDSSSDSDA
ncbi:hypothetical protein BDW71DRAFT_174486 [Aspergillus fruticulosus]